MKILSVLGICVTILIVTSPAPLHAPRTTLRAPQIKDFEWYLPFDPASETLPGGGAGAIVGSAPRALSDREVRQVSDFLMRYYNID